MKERQWEVRERERGVGEEERGERWEDEEGEKRSKVTTH